MILYTEFCEDPETGKKVMAPLSKTILVNKRSSQGQGQGQSHLPSTNCPDLIHLLTKFGPEIL